jgi:hypothetical protein
MSSYRTSLQVQGGDVPAAGPPGPPPPAPAPGPPSTVCTFKNQTEIVSGGGALATYEVGFLDQDACCGACRGTAGCASAELFGSGTTSGSPSEWHSKCVLYNSVGTQSAHKCDWPCARMTITPQ